MKRVIVTGANGFIGSSLIKKLIENNVEVVAIDISFNKSHLPESNYIKRIESGLNDLQQLKMLIPSDEYDAFYHLAWAGVNGEDKANPLIQTNNIEMAINCATLSKDLNCEKLLCAGTIAERSVESLSNLEKTNGGMTYGIAKHCTHLMLETYCKNINQPFVWMQFSNIYGPSNKTGNLVSYTLGELAKGNDAIFGPANQPYDFIYIDDLIEAVYRLGDLNTTKNIYFIGSGEPRILKNYLHEIGEIFGKPELIKVGIRPDDRIIYSIDMFNINNLKQDIGDYISKSFSEGIQYTIDNY